MRLLGYMAQTFIFVIFGLIVLMLLLTDDGLTGLLSGSRDSNVAYSIEVSTPDEGTLIFTGVTGCDRTVTKVFKVTSTATDTLNPTAVLVNGADTWLLTGFDCARVGRTMAPHDFTLYKVTGPVTARRHFMDTGLPMRISGGSFEVDTLYFDPLNTTPPTRSYNQGPYVYLSFNLAIVPEFLTNLARPVVLSGSNDVCGKRNAPANWLALSGEQRAALSSAYTGYVPGQLEFSEAADGWQLGGPLAIENGFSVAYKEEEPDPLARLPAECVALDYDGEEYVLSASSADATLYLPATNTVIQTDSLSQFDIQVAVRRAGEWSPCDPPLVGAVPAPGEIRVDRADYGASNPPGVNKLDRLVKNEAGAAVCIANNGYQWL